jgi:maltooligosyltrehalose trehalohydrolase
LLINLTLERFLNQLEKSTVRSVNNLIEPVVDVGAFYLGDGRCRFTVWAPLLKQVAVKLVEPIEKLVPLQPADCGYWTGVIDGVEPGTYYLYQLNGENEQPDPASRSQPDGVYGASEVVAPQSFRWSDTGWTGLPLEDLILYEIHIGTFTPEGTFAAAISRLPRLKELGINAIEVMPVAQFSGDRNWGYDGVFPYAVQNSYGGVAGFQKFINACHQEGIAVVLDVVYNHLGPEGNCFECFGPFLTDKYHGSWGNAFNLDDAYCDGVREFLLDNAIYWLESFHIDALRLDAIQGIYDLSAHHFLEEMVIRVDRLAEQTGRKLWLMAESDLNDVRIIRARERGGFGVHSQWCDDFHHSLHALITGESHAYYQDFGHCEDLAKSFREGFVYSGQYAPHRFRKHGSSSLNEPAHQFIVFSQNHDQTGNRILGDRLSNLTDFEGLKLTAATVLLSPYVPLLFMGEEYGETNPFLYFISHSDQELIDMVRRSKEEEFKKVGHGGDVYDPQSVEVFNQCKLDWERQQKGNHQNLWNFYQHLIQLRHSHPVLKKLDKKCLSVSCHEESKLMFVHRWRESDQVYYLMNFSDRPQTFEANPPDGSWEKILDSADSIWAGPGSALSTKLLPSQSVTIPAKGFALYKT